MNIFKRATLATAMVCSDSMDTNRRIFKTPVAIAILIEIIVLVTTNAGTRALGARGRIAENLLFSYSGMMKFQCLYFCFEFRKCH